MERQTLRASSRKTPSRLLWKPSVFLELVRLYLEKVNYGPRKFNCHIATGADHWRWSDANVRLMCARGKQGPRCHLGGDHSCLCSSGTDFSRNQALVGTDSFSRRPRLKLSEGLSTMRASSVVGERRGEAERPPSILRPSSQ